MAELAMAHSYLILLAPLLAFVVIGLCWPGLSGHRYAGGLAVALAAVNLAVGSLLALTVSDRVFSVPGLAVVPLDFAWLNFTSTLTANLGIYLDSLSVVMMMVVVSVALPVMIYSLGYMRGEEGFGRYFALLSLFVFSMLGLVLAGNIFQLFVFWELVGVSSYFLIGYWYQKPSAVAASKKAFIVTRFADAFFLLGIIMLGYHAGSFDFAVLNDPATATALREVNLPLGSGLSVLTVATLLVFIGGWGKSAMFPLHIWLPDAMEGPTPVSAIIHSATMVVAGIFLTARMFPLFAAADITLDVVLLVGAFTAVFAAVIALTQFDIKRILAFSTLSQLGFMMFSLGAARLATADGINALGYSASIFHIFTHAYFKCLLFLGAGILIHAVHHNSIERMGGLRRHLPITYWSMLIACLAIAGIFPLAGFWSKDAILMAAWQSGHHFTFVVGLLVGGLTALYMFRLFFLVFHGQPRFDTGHQPPAEEPVMAWPVAVLAVPAVLAGVLAENFFINNVVPPATVLPLVVDLPHPGWLPVLAGLTGLAGLGAAWLLYGQGNTELAANWRRRLEPFSTLVANKFYIDEVYLYITRRIIFDGIAAPIKWFDRRVVDGVMNATAKLLDRGGEEVRRFQSGLLSLYLGMVVLGIAFLFFFGGFPF